MNYMQESQNHSDSISWCLLHIKHHTQLHDKYLWQSEKQLLGKSNRPSVLQIATKSAALKLFSNKNEPAPRRKTELWWCPLAMAGGFSVDDVWSPSSSHSMTLWQTCMNEAYFSMEVRDYFSRKWWDHQSGFVHFLFIWYPCWSKTLTTENSSNSKKGKCLLPTCKLSCYSLERKLSKCVGEWLDFLYADKLMFTIVHFICWQKPVSKNSFYYNPIPSRKREKKRELTIGICIHSLSQGTKESDKQTKGLNQHVSGFPDLVLCERNSTLPTTTWKHERDCNLIYSLNLSDTAGHLPPCQQCRQSRVRLA